ncbi:hypothetical protein GIY62_35115 (plasmid) [Burkholderia plantarii]|uniref:hypothetical protein n=1 Tax=Burkholderia plantarii TaxID=41899 RepID=UPI00272D7284|nr:hypothetical protein [Burkholderia plantarii]WLE64097.1 hypothetical protein GIY62_35115 [Burkholderia plantarii]
MAAIGKMGITEEYWGGMSEDQKLCWEIFIRILAVVAGLFVVKTGVTVVDCVIGATAAFTPFLVIRSQRSFRKHSRVGRKRLLGAVVFMGSTGASVLGLLYFGLALLSAAAQTYRSEMASFRHRPDSLEGIVILGVFFISVSIGAVKAWRNLNLRQMLFVVPKRALKRLMLQRKYVADGFVTFAHFELSVQIIAFAYATVIANVVKVYLRLF